MKIVQLRDFYTETDTLALVLLNSKFFSYCLEDKVRHTTKQYGATAIPAGVYEVRVTYSPRFKRMMPLIVGVPGFSGIRIHGGNKAKHTLGCPLYAKNRTLKAEHNMIWGSMEKELTKRLLASKDKKHWIEIINTQMPAK